MTRSFTKPRPSSAAAPRRRLRIVRVRRREGATRCM
jgi:hypothetical protein